MQTASSLNAPQPAPRGLSFVGTTVRRWEKWLLGTSFLFLALGMFLSFSGMVLLWQARQAASSSSELVRVTVSLPTAYPDCGIEFATEQPPTPTPSPTATATETPTSSPTTVTSEPATATPEPNAPTDTPSPTPTPTPTVDPTPLPTRDEGQFNAGVPSFEAEQSEVVAPPSEVNEINEANGCPVTSTAHFDVIPIEQNDLAFPDHAHPDHNLSLRPLVPSNTSYELVDYNGATDGDAPQFRYLFSPPRAARIAGTYQVHDWNWGCGASPQGCLGELLTDWEAHIIEFSTQPGESIFIADRQAEIYPGGYEAMVIYAEPP